MKDRQIASCDMADDWATTVNSTFDVTGVQIEVGSVATKPTILPFDEDLRICQRYFFQSAGYQTDWWPTDNYLRENCFLRTFSASSRTANTLGSSRPSQCRCENARLGLEQWAQQLTLTAIALAPVWSPGLGLLSGKPQPLLHCPVLYR